MGVVAHRAAQFGLVVLVTALGDHVHPPFGAVGQPELLFELAALAGLRRIGEVQLHGRALLGRGALQKPGQVGIGRPGEAEDAARFVRTLQRAAVQVEYPAAQAGQALRLFQVLLAAAQVPRHRLRQRQCAPARGHERIEDAGHQRTDGDAAGDQQPRQRPVERADDRVCAHLDLHGPGPVAELERQHPLEGVCRGGGACRQAVEQQLVGLQFLRRRSRAARAKAQPAAGRPGIEQAHAQARGAGLGDAVHHLGNPEAGAHRTHIGGAALLHGAGGVAGAVDRQAHRQADVRLLVLDEDPATRRGEAAAVARCLQRLQRLGGGAQVLAERRLVAGQRLDQHEREVFGAIAGQAHAARLLEGRLAGRRHMGRIVEHLEARILAVQAQALDVLPELRRRDGFRGVEQGAQPDQHLGVGVEALTDLVGGFLGRHVHTRLCAVLDLLPGDAAHDHRQRRTRGQHQKRQGESSPPCPQVMRHAFLPRRPPAVAASNPPSRRRRTTG
jgi:hypothetical protein